MLIVITSSNNPSVTSVDPVFALLQVQLLLAERNFSLLILEVGKAVAAGVVAARSNAMTRPVARAVGLIRKTV